jgi:hypothetical protein
LLRQLTAHQLWEWWQLWKEEPWSDDRADMRGIAQMAATVGVADTSLLWPYFPEELTAEEIRQRMADLEEAIAANERRNNQNRD